MPVKFRDYYEVLGVSRGASADVIKAAYRRLARKNHPDLHQGKARVQAEEAFKAINEANAVLSDADKRGALRPVRPRTGWQAAILHGPRRGRPPGGATPGSRAVGMAPPTATSLPASSVARRVIVTCADRWRAATSRAT